jgi:hypothetical protein
VLSTSQLLGLVEVFDEKKIKKTWSIHMNNWRDKKRQYKREKKKRTKEKHK